TTLVLAGLLSGCITPTPQELEAAETARAQAAILLGSFEKAMQQKDVRLLQPLLAPTLRPREVRELENHARAAMLLEVYTGYTLDLEAAFARTHWQDWSRGDVQAWVRGTNQYDETFRDRFHLVEARGAWWIRGFRLDQPRAGDHIVPSDRIKAQILPKAAQLLERLKNRELATIYYDLPDDPAARNRMPTQTFWESIFQGDAPPAISVLDDIRVFHKLSISDWPDPRGDAVFVYVPPNGVGVVYEIPYAWPGGGVRELDVMRMEIRFLRREEGWIFCGLFLSGQAFVFS
ncbi:MAG: hypothetical protein ACYS8L_08985, partial [Planctomycetota bacterium]